MSATAPRGRLLQASSGTNVGAFGAVDWTIFVAVSVIWGSSFLLIAEALEHFEPGLVTWGRVGLGAVVLNVVPAARVPIDADDRPRVLALSVLWVGVPFTCFPIAEQYINSAVTGMLNGATPVFAAIVVAVLSRRLPGATQAIGLVLGLAGVVVIAASQHGEGDNGWIGVALVLGATVCYGVAVNLAGPLQQRYGSLGVMARVLAWAALWTTPFGLWSLPGSEFSWRALGAVTVIGALGTALAFVLMGRLVGSVGPTRASLITYLIPVVALVLGVTFRDDHVAAAAGLGVAGVVAGAYLASRAERPLGDPVRPRQ